MSNDRIKEGRPANEEMIAGYVDGLDLSSPPPSDNRSHSYRHGFANGRDDLSKKPRAVASILREHAATAIEKDATR